MGRSWGALGTYCGYYLKGYARQGAESFPWDHHERGMCHAQDESVEVIVDAGAMRAGGRMDSDGLLRAGCGVRLEGNLTEKGGEKIGWAGM